MTISSENRKAGPFSGNGVTTAFPFTFKVFATNEVYVVRADEDGIESVLVLNSDYTVALNANQNTNPGGTVTLSAPLADDFTMVVTSDIEYLQPTDLTNQGGFYPNVINNALDRLTILTQQLREDVNRSAKLPITNPADATSLVADIVRLADSAAQIDTVAGSIADVNTVAENIVDIQNAEENANAAAESAAAAAASYDNFDDRYLGAKNTAPTTDNDGNPLLVGAVYWDTPSSQMFTWSGTAWRPTFLVGNTVRAVVIATAGQTLVPTPTYLQGSNSLTVFVNGSKPLLGTDWLETTQNSITFTTPLLANDEVELIAQQSFATDELRSDLASTATGKGAALVGYLPAGTGAVPTTVQNALRYLDMDGVKRLSDVDKSVGISYMVRGFYAGSKIGGGQYAWDASKSKSDHNGWTVVAPEALASWDGSANTVATMLSWTGAGNGAFVMVKQGAYDKSTGLKNLRLSIAKTKLSEESTRVVMLGDSTFAGSGAGGVTGYSADARKFGPTVALKNVLTENGWSAYSEGIIGNQNAGDMASFCAWDTRFQNFGGWIFSTLNSFYTSVFSNSGSTSALRFTPSATFDTIRIWYAAGSGTRQFTVQANNAGSPTTVESGDPSGQMRYFDYTAPAGATYVDVRRVTGSINILGFEAYVSAVKGISLIQMGRSGGRIANALPSTTQWDALNCVKNLSPNLVVINLAINEWINNGDLGIYYSNLLSIATSLRASNSDVAIVTGVPTEISNTSTARQEKYVECLKLFSLLNNVVLIDTWGSIESKENYSLLYADFAHPNKYGYRDFAQNISKIFAIAEGD